jgi:hypothetical protein
MAIFASTTTSGYSDPLKAQSIKALEARYKDMLAQSAAQPGITPENTQTPIQGFGHVANQLVDSFKQRQVDQAAAEGRNELAGVIAQGPRGPDGSWAPDQLSVMARRSPELMEKFYAQQHENKQNVRTDTGQTLRAREQNTTTLANTGLQNTSRELISGNEIKSAREIAELKDRGETARTGISTNSAESIAAARNAAEAERQASGQTHEVSLTTHKANLEQLQRARDQAFASGQTEKGQAFEKEILGLKNEFAAKESGLGRTHDMAKLNQSFANDSKLAELNGKIRTEQIVAEIAGRDNDNKARLASEDRLQKLRIEADDRRTFIKQVFDIESQKQAEGAKAELQAKNLASEEKRAADALAAKKAEVNPGAIKGLEESSLQYRQMSTMGKDVKTALGYLDKGINEGLAAPIKSGAAAITGNLIVDKEKAQRTNNYNNIVNNLATMDMSKVLKGSSTDKEMAAFRQVHNDPQASFERKVQALQNLLVAIEADKGIHATAIRGYKGNPEEIDKAMSGPPRPEGKSDADILKAAQTEMATASPTRKAAIQQQLDVWNVKGR